MCRGRAAERSAYRPASNALPSLQNLTQSSTAGPLEGRVAPPKVAACRGVVDAGHDPGRGDLDQSDCWRRRGGCRVRPVRHGQGWYRNVAVGKAQASFERIGGEGRVIEDE